MDHLFEQPAYYTKKVAGFTIPFSLVWTFGLIRSLLLWEGRPLTFIIALVLLIFVGFAVNLALAHRHLKHPKQQIWLKPYIYLETTMNYLALVLTSLLMQIGNIGLLWSPIFSLPMILLIGLFILMLTWFTKQQMPERAKIALTQFVFTYSLILLGLFLLLGLVHFLPPGWRIAVVILYLVIALFAVTRFYKKRLPKNMAGDEF